MNTDASAELSDDLSELFGESVGIKNDIHRTSGETRISIVDMSYNSYAGDQIHHYKQTAVVLTQDDLDVPDFTLRPTVKGITGKIFAVFGNMADINFDDSPKFSRDYYLHGWVEESVRVLFIPEIREFFARNTRWSVRGRGKQLVIFQQNQTFKADAHDGFVKVALSILTLFQQGEEALDERPELRRATSPEDLTATVERMDGVTGAMLKRQFDAVRVTPAQLDTFADSPTPRTAPVGLRRQVFGQNHVAILFGVAMAIFGTGFALISGILGNGNEKFIAIPIGLMAVIGFIIMFFAWRFRSTKSRVLRSGLLRRGVITDVSRTKTSINNQQQYLATVEYQESGIQRTTQCKIYGLIQDQAKAKKNTGEKVRVLIDPEDPTNAICLDLLLVFAT